MFSDRRHQRVIGAVLLAALPITSLSCGKVFEVGEAQAPNASLQMGGDTACLSDASAVLSDFVSGKASEGQINDFFFCLNRSLRLFQENTHGSQPGTYSPRELRNFMERYFLRNFHISDGFLTELMELKRTLIGGSTDSLTSDDLSRLRNLIESLHQQSLAIRTYLPLSPQRVEGLSKQQMLDSITALRRAALSLGELLQERASPYSFLSLDRLLYEIGNFLEEASSKDTIAQARKNLPIFRQIKKVMVSSDDQTMAGTDWRVLLSTAADFYSFYLRYRYTIKNEPSLISGEGREELVKIAADGYALISQVFERQPRGTVTYADMDKLIDLMEPNSFTVGDAQICPQHIKNFLRPLLKVFLSPNAPVDLNISLPHRTPDWKSCVRLPTPPDEMTDGLRKEHLKKLWDLVTMWTEGQRFSEKTFELVANGNADTDPLKQSYLPADLLRPSLSDVLQLPDEFIGKVTRDAAMRIRGIFEVERPLFRQGDSEIYFDGKSADGRHHFEGMSKLYGIQLAVNLALQAYLADPNRLNNPNQAGITRNELYRFYEDTKEIGIDVKLYDPTLDDAYKKRFMEANLFTFSANGDDYMSLNETTDLIGILISSKGLSSRTYDTIYNECRNESPNNIGGHDLFDRWKIASGCFRHAYWDEHYKEFWDHMPNLLAFYEKLPIKPAQKPSGSDARKVIYRDTFRCMAEKVSRVEVPDYEQYLDSGDADQISALLQYMEALFMRFDTDNSGTLNLKETTAAYPVLKKTLHDAVKALGKDMNSDDDLMAILTYLLKYGEVPSTMDFIWWRYVRYNLGYWEFESDRGKIMQIMGQITGKSLDSCLLWPGETLDDLKRERGDKTSDPNHRSDPAPQEGSGRSHIRH